MSVEIKVPRKLIEVALPLDAINQESLRRKQKAPKGWPTSFHKWWAQRPIAAARAVLFAQLVNDPGFQHGDGFKYGKNKKEAAAERKRLFRLMEELVKWDNSDDEELLQEARREIWKSWREVCDLNQDHPSAAELFDPDKFPVIYDPFAGSGTIPLEAQWLGLSTIASDLNPVAVLLNRAMIEFPFRFANRRPASVAKSGTMNFDSEHNEWKNSRGLAEDVRNYSAWMRKEAERRIGNLYPPIEVTAQMAKDRPDLKSLVGESLPVTAWIWARTVKSPNPKFSHIDVPLVSNYVLSNKGANAFVEPEVKADSYYFRVKVGTPPANASKGTKLARGANFACLMSGMPIDADYIKAEGIAGRMGCRLMAIVAQSGRGRVYLSPTAEQEEVAFSASPQWQPDISISGSTQYLGIKPYGIETFSQLFTKRQLVALTTLCDLVSEAAQRCRKDALDAGLPDDGKSLDDGGVQVTAYAEALAVYLAIIVDRVAFYGSMLCGWLPKDNAMGKTMPQQALAMSWDFAEGNPLGKSSTDVTTCSNSISSFLEIATPNASVVVDQRDAQSEIASASKYIFSTDPPYYDNVPYADLSDFFYVWLRKSLRPILPKLFATVTTPKENELVAFAHRHKEGKLGAADFFLNGMSDTMRHLVKSTHPAFPATIYYAFKETENDSTSGSSRAGWETFLESVVKAGFAIDGTWPLRTEGEKRMRASGSNALASSIVLVCRKRSSDALTASRREFIRELNSVLPIALER